MNAKKWQHGRIKLTKAHLHLDMKRATGLKWPLMKKVLLFITGYGYL